MKKKKRKKKKKKRKEKKKAKRRKRVLSFVLKWPGGQHWTIQTAYEAEYDTEWEGRPASSLGVWAVLWIFFIVVVVDCTAAASGIRIFNVGVPVWILN